MWADRIGSVEGGKTKVRACGYPSPRQARSGSEDFAFGRAMTTTGHAMAASDFAALVARHRKCFLSGKTRPVEWREAQLDALYALMTERAPNARSRDPLSALQRE
jgi:hypothetical protein